jgi:hypothetical protein
MIISGEKGEAADLAARLINIVKEVTKMKKKL